MRRALLRALAMIALVIASASLVLATPTAASAAPKPIGLSSDGVTYADSLPASVFAGVLIVPGTSVTRTFYVKNRSALPGNLAIALKGITGTSASLISALSLRTTAGTTTGPNVPFSAAAPCAPLVSGLLLPAGAVMQVDVRLTLSSSLDNQTAQGSVGGFLLPVTLTSTDVPAPTGCAVTTPVNPPAGGGGGGTPPGNPTGTIDTAVISGAADGTVPETVDDGALSGLAGRGSIRGYVIIPNTSRFFQELDVVAWLVLLVLGGIVAWWRRRGDEEAGYVD